MSVGQRDPHTGLYTTGHEWAGITELNTPIPRAVKFFYAVTFAVALLQWVLYPAWPLLTSYTAGILGFSQRDVLNGQLAEAKAQRATWSDKVASTDLETLAQDPEVLTIVARAGQTLFDDNCLVCHGAAGRGGPGFPNLSDEAWLWGGSLVAIHETLRVGINAGHDDTRSSQMLAFGRDQLLGRTEIRQVVAYLRSLSGLETPDPETAEAGAAHFVEQCASCHGEDAKGLVELGAPNLTDDFWIYGGDREAVYTTVFDGRQGQMPHWEQRLSPVQIKLLALYVHGLGGP